jgi:hypothetical protein
MQSRCAAELCQQSPPPARRPDEPDLDAGALLAVERSDRDTVALIKQELLARRTPLTHGGIVGQVWRGGSGRQTMTSFFRERPSNMPARRPIDAALVLLASDGDFLLTSDPHDLKPLAASADLHVEIVFV